MLFYALSYGAIFRRTRARTQKRRCGAASDFCEHFALRVGLLDMAIQESTLDVGFIRSRGGNRAFDRTGGRHRAQKHSNTKPSQYLVNEHSAAGDSSGALDSDIDRGHVNGGRGKVHRRINSKNFGLILAYACWAAWGGLAGLFFVVAIKVVYMI